MLKKGMTKQEMLDVLKSKGDFVQIDYVTRFLKEEPPFDMKRFLYITLAEIYEKKKLYMEVAKMYHSAAMTSIKFSDKIKMHTKETEAFIKFGAFEKADEAMRKAFSEANSEQKTQIYSEVKEFYKQEGEAYLKEGRKNKAINVYKKFLEMNISDSEREEFSEKLSKISEGLRRF